MQPIELIQKLEDKIDSAIENMELLRLQLEELETKNASLEKINADLKAKQNSWEQNISIMLDKLEALESECAEPEAMQSNTATTAAPETIHL